MEHPGGIRSFMAQRSKIRRLNAHARHENAISGYGRLRQDLLAQVVADHTDERRSFHLGCMVGSVDAKVTMKREAVWRPPHASSHGKYVCGVRAGMPMDVIDAF